MAKGALIAAMDFSNVDAGEFNDWYDTEHIPERQRVPGFLALQRWIGAENPRQSVATYDLDNIAVLQSPGYRAIGGENLSPWSKRVTAKVERLLRYEGEQINPGDKTAPANAGGLLLVGMTPGAEVESGVQHVVRQGTPSCPFPAFPACCAHGVIRSSGGGTKYVALYHLTAPGVIELAGVEAGERINPDAAICARPDQQPHPPRLPELRAGISCRLI